jgi:hypothetical protein
MKPTAWLTTFLALMTAVPLMALPPGTITDEAAVPPYTLPDPLLCADGSRVKDAATWEQKRRPETLRLLEDHIFGKTILALPPGHRWVVREEKKGARAGKATRLRVAQLLTGKEDGPQIEWLVYLPTAAPGPVPLFIGLNFEGNYVTTDEPDIPLPTHWVANKKTTGITDNKAAEKARGSGTAQWHYDMALDAGFGVMTAAYCAIEPDFPEGINEGVHTFAPRQESGDWGAIGAWAWGMSRALDWALTEPRIDGKRIMAMGHSRLGKTALWAGAQDTRFALVISNDSGAGGAAPSRRLFGETVAVLNTNFPNWFCLNHRRYNGKESECPVDHHQLLALIAPRPLLVHSATLDLWADPKGEFLSTVAATPVYRLLGVEGMRESQWPAADQLIDSRIGYFLRTGVHDVTTADWQSYITFAKKHLARP